MDSLHELWDWSGLITLIGLLLAFRSLERRARYLFYCMFFCSLFVNDFSTTRRPIHAKFCMRAYSGSGFVFSLLGVSGPRGRKKGEMSNANGGFVSVLLTHLFLVCFSSHFLFVPCGRLSQIDTSAFYCILYRPYTVSYRIVRMMHGARSLIGVRLYWR